jgi:Lar family restriction alleviation protein
MEELKPCPFCGSKDVEVRAVRGNALNLLVFSEVNCKNCFIGIHDGNGYSTFESSKRAISQAWNKISESQK